MRLNDVNKLVEQKVYEITVIEFSSVHQDDTQVTYKAEYRGLDKWEGYLLFWKDGDRRASEFHYEDILTARPVQ